MGKIEVRDTGFCKRQDFSKDSKVEAEFLIQVGREVLIKAVT